MGTEPGLKVSRQSRRASYIIAKYTVMEGTFRDIIKNIGSSGLFIRTSRKVSEGQAIVLEFPLFDFDVPIQATGTVVRRDKNGIAVMFGKTLDNLAGKDGKFPEIIHEGNR
jgi:hypothetical protein